MQKDKKSNLSIRSTGQLANAGLITDKNSEVLNEVVAKYKLSITPTILELIDRGDSKDPIARQFVPNGAEIKMANKESLDPIGDNNFSPIKGLVHRYPDRVLLMPTFSCPVYCRYCFRRDRVGHGKTVPSYTDLERAIDYIEKDSFIREVILTGGDPLILSDTKLKFLIRSLNKISHLNNLRIHTRVPIASPDRITNSLLRVLRTELPIWIALHCNHPRELGEEAQTACKRLIDGGLPMVSQSVLLKGVNNNINVLTELMRTLVRLRIKPYYIHHPDRAPGTSHFQITIEEGLALVEGLRGKISGLCQPTYVLDIPGGYGKTPLTRKNVVSDNLGWKIRDYKGHEHFYPRT